MMTTMYNIVPGLGSFPLTLFSDKIFNNISFIVERKKRRKFQRPIDENIAKLEGGGVEEWWWVINFLQKKKRK